MNTQLNTATYRKFNNLLNSGAVTVTGPGQPRILKTTRLVVPNSGGATTGGGGNVSAVGVSSAGSVAQQLADGRGGDSEASGTRCYICDELLSASQAQNPLTEMSTTHTSTKFPNKLAQLVGEGFVVIVSTEDYVCSRCTNLVNYFDRLENDVERVKANLLNLLNKKYGINEDGSGQSPAEVSPPLKMQKLAAGSANRSLEENAGAATRKVPPQSAPVSAVQQLKIATPVAQSPGSGAQQVQRKATKIYKCTSCDYKTSDMRLFNTHFETCKQQTFQCKTCRKIFPHFGAMKQHMVRDHNTAMDNTCAMCHINFVNETSLRKHMESNHATNVLVTSTTTIPAAATPNPAVDLAAGSALYTCNHCQFKSTDKGVFDEHMRKHVTGKPKPFKCRLCSQRFETREAATVHAKQHQTNYFKCGTCSKTFPKRELLVQHFEVHQSASGGGAHSPGAKQPATQNLNTQKLLQETIDEALSDSVPQTGGGAANAAAAVVAASAEAAENNIRFFSCSICSLTFIQETYYNHHMETHRRDKKNAAASGGGGGGGNAALLNSAATALLSDDAGEPKHEEQSEQSAEADIESLFEKLHSEKSESGGEVVGTTSLASGKSKTAGGEMVITSQEGSGGITFNITIPQVEAPVESGEKGSPAAPVSVSIDMPMLDQAEDESQASGEGKASDNVDSAAAETKSSAAPVSMPSLDDDNEAAASSEAESKAKASDKSEIKEEQHGEEQQSEAAAAEAEKSETPTTEPDANAAEGAATADGEAAANNEGEGEAEGEVEGEGEAGEEAAGGDQQVAMELDEAMQAQVDGGQIKFIVNESGHLLQLDNHILTDAEGNQIIVQDPEQIQQLLQSVGVLQSGEGLEGETLQMMTDGSGQMVLVHGDNNEQQLIDASLLNSEGQLIIQQGQDGDEGPHVISEDGTRIPVSVSYTEDGQPIVQVQQQVLEAANASAEEKEEAEAQAAAEEEQEEGEAAPAEEGAAVVTTSTASSSSGGGAAGGSFFALEEFAETKTD